MEDTAEGLHAADGLHVVEGLHATKGVCAEEELLMSRLHQVWMSLTVL